MPFRRITRRLFHLVAVFGVVVIISNHVPSAMRVDLLNRARHGALDALQREAAAVLREAAKAVSP